MTVCLRSPAKVARGRPFWPADFCPTGAIEAPPSLDLPHAASARILLPQTAMSRYSPLDSASDDTRHRDAGRDRPREAHPEREIRDPRDVLSRDLDLPRHAQRQRARVHDRVYALRDSEVRTLAAVGAFRIVDTRDLGDDARHTRRDVQHLRDLGLLESVGPQFRDGERASAVVLTREGKQLLEAHRVPRGGGPPQAYYAGLAKPREALHDAQLYRTYLDAAQRLQDAGARVQRVVLDYELKREYQQFLQARNRGKRDADGRPDRSAEEIQDWARTHGLPVDDHGRVQFPDVRIEYEHPDGRPDRLDLELATEHYSSRQMAGKKAAGFAVAHGASSRGRSAPFDPRAAERLAR
jgi:DNA-binding PadR family transcriptional regulator